MASDNDIFTQILVRELFNGPCKCCGNMTHGILTSKRDRNGLDKFSISCPIVEGDNWERVLQKGLTRMAFRPDSKRFAQSNLGRTEEALAAFQVNGYGRFMDYMSLIDFDNDVQRETKMLMEKYKKGETLYFP